MSFYVERMRELYSAKLNEIGRCEIERFDVKLDLIDAQIRIPSASQNPIHLLVHIQNPHEDVFLPAIILINAIQNETEYLLCLTEFGEESKLFCINFKEIFCEIIKRKKISIEEIDFEAIKRDCEKYPDVLFYFRFDKQEIYNRKHTELKEWNVDHDINYNYDDNMINFNVTSSDLFEFYIPEYIEESLIYRHDISDKYLFCKNFILNIKRYKITATNKLSFSQTTQFSVIRLNQSGIKLVANADWRLLFNVQSIYNRKEEHEESQERVAELIKTNFAPKKFFWVPGVDNDLWW
jgi:hypothetical protein